MKQVLYISLLAIAITVTTHAQQAKNTYLGKTDFQSLIGAIPAMPSTTEAAFEYAYNNNINENPGTIMQKRFESFNKKKELMGRQLESAVASKSKQYYAKKGQEGLNNDYKRQVDQNEIIKEMGGVDNIKKMSEAQRKEAAKNAAAKQASSTAFSPFTEEEMKRMMSDPEYAQQMAAKYNNLTEKQKAEMVQKMSSAYASPKAPQEAEAGNREFEKTLAKRQTARNVMNVTTFTAGLQQRISDAISDHESTMKRLREGAGSHKDLQKAFDAAYKKIPLVVMGEGKEPDPEKEKKLRIHYAFLHKQRAATELVEAQTGYKKLLAVINQAISEYDDYLEKNQYRINGKMSDVLKGTNTELTLLQVEQEIGTAISIAGNICYDETSLAAGHEQRYREMLTYK